MKKQTSIYEIEKQEKFENFVKEIYDKTLIKISNKNLSKLGIKEKEIKDYHKLSKEIGKRLYSNSTKDALKRLGGVFGAITTSISGISVVAYAMINENLRAEYFQDSSAVLMGLFVTLLPLVPAGGIAYYFGKYTERKLKKKIKKDPNFIKNIESKLNILENSEENILKNIENSEEKIKKQKNSLKKSYELKQILYETKRIINSNKKPYTHFSKQFKKFLEN